MVDEEQLRWTPLTAWHTAHGARMAPFAGWWMPLSYQGTVAEHRAVRRDVGVFDVSHLGTVSVTGPGARQVVSRTFTNDPGGLADGTAQYTLCCDRRGGIVDDLIVYRVTAERFLAVPNAANTAEVVRRLVKAAEDRGVAVEDVTADRALLAVQGPRSLEVVERVTGVGASRLGYLAATEAEVGGRRLLVARTGYTGEVGCEVLVPAEPARSLWESLVEGEEVTPAGLGARDTLRLEMGYPLHGQDLDRDTDPYEARLGWAVALDHGPFTGRTALRGRAAEPPRRRLWGLEGRGRRPPRSGMEVLSDGRRVGTVTSGTTSPTRGVGIGLAYLDDPLAPGDEVTVDVRGTPEPFTVVRPPFVDRDPRG